jgi:hypothetical protein
MVLECHSISHRIIAFYRRLQGPANVTNDAFDCRVTVVYPVQILLISADVRHHCLEESKASPKGQRFNLVIASLIQPNDATQETYKLLARTA